ncbi:MAG TPA: TonB family protein [Vicinamibacterales bacterium]
MPGWSEPDRIGRYERLQRIGGGAMGTVYRAYDPHIDRTIAIKVLLVHDDPALRERFQQEVRAAGTLSHQNIVGVHDFGDVDGRPYIVMEYVDGRTLSDVLLDPAALTLADKLRLMQQLCAALDYAHTRGIVHRDIKPANLMIDRRGDLKVVDFGIAKLGDGQLTRTGNVLGTLAYMSPEQIEGRSIDRRSDIFSVGVVLYELVTSRHAFQGDTPSTIIRAIIYDQPVALTTLVPDLDPELDRIVKKALQKDPAQRYQTLAQMAADLARVRIATEPAIARDDGTGTLLIDRRATSSSTASVPPPLAPGAATVQTYDSSGSRWVVAVAAVALIVAIGAGVLLTRSILFKQSATGPTTQSTGPAPSVGVDTTSKTSAAPTPAAPTSTVATNATDKAKPQPDAPPKKIDTIETAPKIEKPVRTPTAYEQARAILAGNPNPEQKSTAAGLLQKACDGGESAACLQAGVMYRDEQLPKNLPLAVQLFQRACDGKIAEGCNNLGFEYSRGTAVPKDEAKAARLFEQACDSGVPPACTNLGRAYQNGRGVAQDAARARTLFQKACDGGGAMGCVDGGQLLMRGIGGPADPTRAVAMFQQACESGTPVACASLGLAYVRGDGVPQDMVRAATLYQRACDSGGAPACNYLAGMYTGGRGVTKDLANAAALLERSCEGNFADACRTLSERYEKGIGVERNPTRASELARRATQVGGSQNSGTTGVPGGVVGGVAGGVAGIAAAPPPPPPPPPPQSAPVRVGRDIKAPTKTKHVNPVYPPIAQSSRVQGLVIIEAVIGPDGKVRDAKVLRSIPLLDQAALDAVKQWEFTATYLKGVAVPVIMTVTVSFTLQ